METTVSVVISCYNKVARIGACIDSAVSQSVGPQVIVVDDGSTDGSCNVIRGFVDSIGIVTNSERKGVCSARNQGKEYASGDYIMFLDGDTVLMPDILAQMKDVLDADDEIGFVYGDYIRSGQYMWVFESEYFKSKEFDLIELCRANYIPTASLVMNYSWLKWDESIERLNDWDFWLSLALRGVKGKYLHKPICTAWFNKGDISMRGTEDCMKWYKIVARKYREKIKNGDYEN